MDESTFTLLAFITSLQKLLTFVRKRLSKWKLTKDELSKLVMFDVVPRNDSVRVNLVGNSDFQLRFNIINQSPVDIELEQAEIIFVCVGVRLKSIDVKRMTIKPGETKVLYIEESMNQGEANKIAKQYKDNNSFISATLEFNCKLHNFSKHVNALTGVKPEFINMPE